MRRSRSEYSPLTIKKEAQAITWLCRPGAGVRQGGCAATALAAAAVETRWAVASSGTATPGWEAGGCAATALAALASRASCEGAGSCEGTGSAPIGTVGTMRQNGRSVPARGGGGGEESFNQSEHGAGRGASDDGHWMAGMETSNQGYTRLGGRN